MISKTLYVCEVCHTEYADKNEANEHYALTKLLREADND